MTLLQQVDQLIETSLLQFCHLLSEQYQLDEKELFNHWKQMNLKPNKSMEKDSKKNPALCKPTRKKSSYSRYYQKRRQIILAENPTIKFGDLSKRISQEWRQLSNESKKQYDRSMINPPPPTLSPIAPSPIAPSPIVPSPIAPSPIVPSPIVPSPVVPSPVVPSSTQSIITTEPVTTREPFIIREPVTTTEPVFTPPTTPPLLSSPRTPLLSVNPILPLVEPPSRVSNKSSVVNRKILDIPPSKKGRTSNHPPSPVFEDGSHLPLLSMNIFHRMEVSPDMLHLDEAMKEDSNKRNPILNSTKKRVVRKKRKNPIIG